jgi:hypothetical protein
MSSINLEKQEQVGDDIASDQTKTMPTADRASSRFNNALDKSGFFEDSPYNLINANDIFILLEAGEITKEHLKQFLDESEYSTQQVLAIVTNICIHFDHQGLDQLHPAFEIAFEYIDTFIKDEKVSKEDFNIAMDLLLDISRATKNIEVATRATCLLAEQATTANFFSHNIIIFQQPVARAVFSYEQTKSMEQYDLRIANALITGSGKEGAVAFGSLKLLLSNEIENKVSDNLRGIRDYLIKELAEKSVEAVLKVDTGKENTIRQLLSSPASKEVVIATLQYCQQDFEALKIAKELLITCNKKTFQSLNVRPECREIFLEGIVKYLESKNSGEFEKSDFSNVLMVLESKAKASAQMDVLRQVEDIRTRNVIPRADLFTRIANIFS